MLNIKNDVLNWGLMIGTLGSKLNVGDELKMFSVTDFGLEIEKTSWGFTKVSPVATGGAVYRIVLLNYQNIGSRISCS